MRQDTSILMLLVMMLAGMALAWLCLAADPDWWAARGVLASMPVTNDFAAANQGQVKFVARQAWLEMEVALPGGAGTAVSNMVAGFSLTHDYAAANVGMLKTMATPFYDRLMSVGHVSAYPWSDDANAAEHALVNVGQVKHLFSFDLPASGQPLISGVVHGSGACTGLIQIIAASHSNAWSSAFATVLPAPGDYAINNLPASSSYWVRAFMDVDADGLPGFCEPQAVYSNNPLHLAGPATSIDMALVDNHAPVLQLPADTTVACGQTPDPRGTGFASAVDDDASRAGMLRVDGPRINEIRADDAGTDDVEFVELVAPAGYALENYVLVHYNGVASDDGGLFQFTFPAFMVPDDGITDADGSALGCVVLSASSNLVPNTDFMLPGDLQNGPDGLVLYDDSGAIVDAVAWSGAGDLPLDDPGTVVTNHDAGLSRFLHVTRADDDTDKSLAAANNVFNDSGNGWVLDLASPGALNPKQYSGRVTLGGAVQNIPTLTVSYSDVIRPVIGGAGAIERTWSAQDSCGNQTRGVQTISIADDDPPRFTYFPPDMTLACGQPPTPEATGRPRATDGCTPGAAAAPLLVRFNEVRADDQAADNVEYIELVARAGMNLAGCYLVHYNGAELQDMPIFRFVFPPFVVPNSGIVDDQGTPMGFVVISRNPVLVAHSDFHIPYALQNGPDGLVLYSPEHAILDAMAWEAAGDLPVDNPGNVVTNGGADNPHFLHLLADDDDSDHSLSAPNDLLADNGAGWALTNPTPGALNLGQVSGRLHMEPGAATVANVTIDHQDQFIHAPCATEWTLRRVWTATDMAGNSISTTQTILMTNCSLSCYVVVGQVTYDGLQTGMVYAVAASVSNDWASELVASMDHPGPYVITGLLHGLTYWVRAWRDADTDQIPDDWEAQATYPLPLLITNNIAGIDLLLADPDIDRDGLPDWWEQQIINAATNDVIHAVADAHPGDDYDHDGLTNGDEYLRGTSPIIPDTDGDGLRDGEETAMNMNPLTAEDGMALLREARCRLAAQWRLLFPMPLALTNLPGSPDDLADLDRALAILAPLNHCEEAIPLATKTASTPSTNLYHYPRRFVPVSYGTTPATAYKVILGAASLTGIVKAGDSVEWLPDQTFATVYEGMSWGYPSAETAWSAAMAVYRDHATHQDSQYYDNAGWTKGTRQAYNCWGAYMWYMKNTIAFYSSTSAVYVSEGGVTSAIACVMVGSLGDYCPNALITDDGPDVNTNYPGADQGDEVILRPDLTPYYKLAPSLMHGVNNDDSDADGIPDFADGYDRDPQEPADNRSENDMFTPWPLTLSLCATNPAQALIRISYNASDPLAVSRINGRYTPAPGNLRLWCKPAAAERSGRSRLTVPAGDYLPPGTYPATNLGFSATRRTMLLHLECVNPGAPNEVVVELDPDGIAGPRPFGCADRGTLTPLKVDLVPDTNHDRKIDDADLGILSVTNPFRFWINNDNDNGDTQDDVQRDMPQEGPGNARNMRVDGIRDLLDFFPVQLDLASLLTVCNPSTVRVILRHDGTTKFFYAGLTPENAGAHLIDRQTAETFQSAELTRITDQGVEVPTAFLQGILQSNACTILAEGMAETQAPLRLEVYHRNGNTLIGAASLPLSLSGVEAMFRSTNMLSAAGQNGGYASRMEEPRNNPDAKTNGKHLVFVHGYNFEPDGARGAMSEIFKRMYWSGSRARFYGVYWYSYESQMFGQYSYNYHINVRHAFQTASNLACFIRGLGGDVTIIAHSLGNMLVSSAISDWAAPVTRYYMLNAAVANEAYNPDVAPDLDAMRHPDWAGYSNRLWSTEWHRLHAPNDARRALTWRGRLAGTSSVAYNFYSDTEDVLGRHEGTPAMLEIEWPNGRYAWAMQEKLKGRNEFWNGFIGSTYGGWAFRSPTNYYHWTEDEWGNPDFYYLYNNDEMTAIPDAKLKDVPMFKPDGLGNGLNMDDLYSDATGSDFAAAHEWQLLAEMIPSLSLPAGKTAVSVLGSRNFEMRASFQTDGVWPPERVDDPDYGSDWLHRDYIWISYLYVYLLYDEFMKLGGLNSP